MKRIILILILIIIIISCSVKKTSNQNNWSESKRLEYLNNVKDSTTWDFDMFESDKNDGDLGDLGPFGIGAFPVPKYDLLGKGSFKGLGSIGDKYPMKNKTLVMNSFFVKKNEFNKRRLKDNKDEIFFQIIISTDTIDNINHNLMRNIVISRNHPDYLGQGFIKTKHNRIDYLAFQTLENNAYAIINTRIFDLNYGKTILIAPQKDKTLKSLQIKSPELTSDSILDYTKRLINENKIIEFFEVNRKI
ncbi:hypothetical protein [Polaribacter sp.]|uniref:hypothetical protein n=1 Tax=Polaribacter sp. TaxID=1920175 RepID=UPI004048E01D